MADSTETCPLDADRLRDLLVAVAKGDGDAFERLYQATSAKLFGICLRVVKQRSDAEDVLQDVYTNIWRKAGQFDASRPGNGIPVTGKDLRAALDAVLAGKTTSEFQAPSIGCNIKWKAGNEPDYF